MSVPSATARPSPSEQLQALTSQATDEMIERARKRELDAVAAAKVVPVSRQRVSLFALYASLPVLVVLVAVTFFGAALSEMVSPSPSPQIARVQAQADLDAAVGAIEDFRADFSTLPQTLVQVGVAPRGDWTYTTAASGHYEVVRALHGQVARYSSTQQQAVSSEK